MRYYACSPREFSIFATHLPKNTNFWYLTTSKWLKCRNSWDIAATKQLEVCNKIFFERVHIWCSKCLPPTKAHVFRWYCKSLQQVILYLLQCSFSSSMVFSFKFVKCLQHCTTHINSQVVKIWWIWGPFIFHSEVCTVGFRVKMKNFLG